jgi:catechol 2,3-dioxygenase-like lactoylglutathione lyase family enzyme/type 1 glutamine amidotransferase
MCMLGLAIAMLLVVVPSVRGDDGPARPRITGLSHFALYVHDIEPSRAFYKDFLGFAEPYSLKNDDGSLKLTWIKINDEQSIELFPEKEAGTDRVYHAAVITDDAEAMRKYLAAKGVAVPEKTPKGKIGNSNYFIKDPDGHTVEIVQYNNDGWTRLNKGKFLPDTRIATHIRHVGLSVGDLAAAKKFYCDILGFQETWRGAKQPTQLSWVHARLPDGEDFLEMMLYSERPTPSRLGVMHHLCLEVPDIAKAKAVLEERAAKINYTQPIEVKVGVNRKRQLNVYDPDGTRVELMEPTTIDGIAAAPSAAPVPTASRSKKVLFFSKSSGYEHAVIKLKDGEQGFAQKILAEIGPKHGIEFTFSKDGSLFSPEYLAQFDAFAFYTTGDLCAAGKDDNPPMSAAGKTAFLDAIHNGKGFVGIHSATDTFHTGETVETDTKQPRTWRYRHLGDKADPYTRMIGAEFIVHGEQQRSTSCVCDQSFPGAPRENFELHEEWYTLTDFSKDLHVILSQDTKGMKGYMYERPSFPATWARMHGKGRVFYTSMGHREDVWTNPLFQELLLGGLKWTTGKVDGDVAPNIEIVTPDCWKLAPLPPATQPAKR